MVKQPTTPDSSVLLHQFEMYLSHHPQAGFAAFLCSNMDISPYSTRHLPALLKSQNLVMVTQVPALPMLFGGSDVRFWSTPKPNYSSSYFNFEKLSGL